MSRPLLVGMSFAACLAASACATGAGVARGGGCEIAPGEPRIPSIPVDQRLARDRAAHLALRDAVSAPLPTAETMVLVMLTSAHHTTTQLSFVATRDTTGRWTVSRTGRTISGLIGIAPENEPITTTELSPAVGADLDRLLADPCLYAQPFMALMPKLPPVGEWGTSLAVITPKRRYAASAFGPVHALGGRVVTAITGW